MTHRPVPPVLVVQHEDGTGPDLVGEQLTLLGLSLDVHHPWAAQPLPTTLDEWSGLLVLGGAPNCEDDSAAPWFPAVRLLMRQAVDRRIPCSASAWAVRSSPMRWAAPSAAATPARNSAPSHCAASLP
ncbi:hypothetical protein ACFQZC_25580 [Streptacidiphilus monticola]